MSEVESTLVVKVFGSRADLGAAAARDIALAIGDAVAAHDSARVVFAAAPSQRETLAALAASPGVPWERVDALHMDEYVGLPPGAPERFGAWLRRHLFDRVPLRSIDVIDPGDDAEAEAARYDAVLAAGPVDVVVLGVGVNGHIAFNDPPVADFRDPRLAKVVHLDEQSRVQQVQDNCFARLEDVPRTAVTLTVPALLRGRRLFCLVPGAIKAPAIRATLREPISTRWPSTILRTHPDCAVYLDADAASLLREPAR
ncbi:6-phosphogluconolactonase [Actinoplanes sp. TFC3]|uniref:6-phosphogluconolactonase n=1 Tax=Actinoplanes sp. TFC3 TaxID=1710355 RepID=UPI00082CC2DD|nr:6-phosphogluconolactonase [Actinoplanes sp. TFC3]